MYANPAKPEACPVLSLAVFLFSANSRDDRYGHLWAGTNSADRFANMLKVVASRLSREDKASLGCSEKDLGPYSARKGSVTYAMSQSTGPNYAAVQLRMGHSLGKVYDGNDNV